MIHRYRRLPAACVLVAVLLGGWGLLRLRAAARAGDALAEGASLGELERRIAAGEVSADVWYAYGQKLLAGREFARAAGAYQKVLQRQPYHRPARFECALALAQGSDRTAFFAFLKQVVYTEPKLAVELFDRREVAALSSDPRFEPLQKEARSQAMD